MSVGKKIGLGAATSAIDSVFNLGSGLLMNKIQYDQQNELMDKSFEQQLDFWHEQQAYNDPSAQMRRLREAGLNPAMLNGNAVNNTAGGLSSVGAPSAPPVQPGHTNVAQSAQALQSILKMAEETGFIDTQNQVMAQELINRIIKNEIDGIVRDMQLTKQDMQELEKLSQELDFEEKFQFAFGRPSVEGGEMLANNRLIDASNKLKADAKTSNEQALKIESDRLFTEALTNTENALRDVRVNLTKAQTASANASAKASVAQASKLMLEGKTIEMQNERDALRNSAMLFYGFDPTSLPNELSATLMNNFAAVVESDWNASTAKEAMDKCHELLKTYRDKSIWTPSSTSYGWNNSVSLGKFSISSGQSSSNSN